jgi:hydroxypyruvate reductase
LILSLIEAAKVAADPTSAVAKHWPPDLGPAGPRVKLLAFGKASMAMAREAVARLGPSLAAGVVTAVPEHVPEPAADLPGVRVLPADHPLPTERNLSAAREVEAFARACEPSDVLLVLLSGGASAHLTSPVEGFSLEELRNLTRDLQRSGATIRELNSVRKHIERLKGGRLAQICPAARIECLVLSDVMGDPLDVIGSGPFAPDPTTFSDALEVLRRRKIDAPAVQRHLEAGAAGMHPETPKPGDAITHHVRHTIIANNAKAVDAAAAAAKASNIRVDRVTYACEGEARMLGRALVESAERTPGNSRVPRLSLCGGEPTVTVGSHIGKGGPSQELVLAAWLFAREREQHHRMWFFSYSTDGIDGPTDAAGAILGPPHVPEQLRTRAILPKASRARLSTEIRDLEVALARHDTYPALSHLSALIRTGPSGTNVNHIWGVLVLPTTT